MRSDSRRPVKVRNRSNQVSGWLLAVGAYPFTVFVDPLGLWTSPPDGGFFDWSITATGVTAVVAIGSYAVFARPYVLRDGDTLIVQNPVSRWVFPLAEVDVDVDALPVPKARFRGKSIWMLSTEHSVMGDLLGIRRPTGRLFAADDQTQPSPSPNDASTGDESTERVGRHWTIFNRVELALLLGWCLYAVSAKVWG